MDELITRCRSAYYLRDGGFVLAVAVVLGLVQLLSLAVGWTDSAVSPFGVIAGFAVLVAVPILLLGSRAMCCRACGVGLHPNLEIRVSEDARPEVSASLRDHDPFAVVATVRDRPWKPDQKATALLVHYCPRCHAVCVADLDGVPRTAFGGDGARALIDIAEVNLG